MTRQELEHIIRAAADVANQNELIIIGSQAILGQYPDAPEELLLKPRNWIETTIAHQRRRHRDQSCD